MDSSSPHLPVEDNLVKSVVIEEQITNGIKQTDNTNQTAVRDSSTAAMVNAKQVKITSNIKSQAAAAAAVPENRDQEAAATAGAALGGHTQPATVGNENDQDKSVKDSFEEGPAVTMTQEHLQRLSLIHI